MAGWPNTKPPIGRLCKERGLLRGRCRCFALSRALEAFRFHAGIELCAVLAAALGGGAFLQRLLYCGVAAGSLLLRVGGLYRHCWRRQTKSEQKRRLPIIFSWVKPFFIGLKAFQTA
jgi:hypothetical protein